MYRATFTWTMRKIGRNCIWHIWHLCWTKLSTIKDIFSVDRLPQWPTTGDLLELHCCQPMLRIQARLKLFSFGNPENQWDLGRGGWKQKVKAPQFKFKIVHTARSFWWQRKWISLRKNLIHFLPRPKSESSSIQIVKHTSTYKLPRKRKGSDMHFLASTFLTFWASFCCRELAEASRWLWLY